MSTESWNAAGAAMEQAHALDVASRQAHAIEAVRPLGPKAGKLHTRRQRNSATPRREPVDPLELTLSTEDGALTFTMKPTAHGLYLERTQRRPLGAHLTQAMLLDSAVAFERWSEAEPVRFDHPVLYSRLLRHGNEYFQARQ